jgi:hypothetical protein
LDVCDSSFKNFEISTKGIISVNHIPTLVRLKNTIFDDITLEYVIYVSVESANVEIESCVFENIKSYKSSVVTKNLSSILIIGGNFTNCEGESGSALYLEDVKNVSLIDSTFSNCVVNNDGSGTIFFNYSTPETKAFLRTIRRCTFLNNIAFEGVDIYDTSENALNFYNENTVTQCRTSSSITNTQSHFFYLLHGLHGYGDEKDDESVSVDCLLESSCGIFIYVSADEGEDHPFCGHVKIPCKTLVKGLDRTEYQREILLLNSENPFLFSSTEFKDYKTYSIRGIPNDILEYPLVETNFSEPMKEYLGRNFTIKTVQFKYCSAGTSQEDYVFLLGDDNINQNVFITFEDIRFSISGDFLSPFIYKNGNSDIKVIFKSCVFNKFHFKGNSCIACFDQCFGKILFDYTSFSDIVAESERSVLLHTDGLVQNHSVKILNTNVSGIG